MAHMLCVPLPKHSRTVIVASSIAQGAMLHSDSWGVSAISYDYLASQIDWYHWDNPDFLAMFAAGNDGESTTAGNPIGEPRRCRLLGR